jgi:hypothetical protein
MARWGASLLVVVVFPLLVAIHLYIAPYTKVEESFNIQAAYDILHYGVPLGQHAHLRIKTLYDHMTFPGAVPRTFIGAMTLAAIAKPIVWFSGTVDDGLSQQMLGERAEHWRTVEPPGKRLLTANRRGFTTTTQCAVFWACLTPRRW